MDAGYSGKPLADKLGLKPGLRACFVNAPAGYVDKLGATGLELLREPRAEMDCVQVFATGGEALHRQLLKLRPLLKPDGMLWVSWPKKLAAKQYGIDTDLTEDAVRDLALPLGLVDVKVCAVDELWSGLKLVIRKELR